MRINITPSWLATIFSSDCSNYTLRVEDFVAKYTYTGGQKSLLYPEIISVDIKKGFIWSRAVIKVTSGETISLGGLSDHSSSQMLRLVSERKQFIAHLTEKLNTLSESIQKEAAWCRAARNGEFWIAESEKLQRLAAAQEFKDFYALPIEYLKDSLNILSPLKEIGGLYVDASQFKEQCNTLFISKELELFKKFFDVVEKNPLTQEQREAIVTNEDATLVVASAGSGKTSLLVGKVGYLLEKQLAKPEEILLLAFNRQAKEEISNRIESRLGVQCDCHTFHSFGLKVIAEANKRKPSLASFIENSYDYTKFINKIANEVLTDDRYSDLVSEYFISHSRPYRDQFDFKSLGEYYEYIRTNRLITLKGETVKSHEELEIANYLFANGVDYIYEQPYEYDTSTAQKRQYKPDFYLPKYEIYIEHYALNRNNETPPFIDREEYVASVEWKRETHRENETILVESYSYQKREGVLTQTLRESLSQYGVQFTLVEPSELLKCLNQQGYLSEFSQLCATFLDLFKGKNQGFEAFRNSLSPEHPDTNRILAFTSLFEDIFNQYEAELTSSKEIDFHDMINEACSLIQSGQCYANYKFVLVDEFQDISMGRARLIQGLQKGSPGIKLLCVGDDWQSIYRFTGSDVTLMTHFPQYFGFTKKLLLTETFRFNDKIEQVASKFIKANPSQISKNILTRSFSERPEVVLFMPNKSSGKYLETIAAEISEESKYKGTTVLLLGRNNSSEVGINYSALKIAAPNCEFEFRTVHRAKGYEADYVVILDLRKSRSGFPNETIDDPIINSLLSASENFEHPEERRLFYVALTRARRRVYLVADPTRPSVFFTELTKNDYCVEKRNLGPEYERFCPICKTSHIVERQGSNGLFYGCENYPLCSYTVNACKVCGIGYLRKEKDSFICENPKCKNQVRLCPGCGDGMLVERKSKSGVFYGCSNYFSTGCDYTKNI